MDTILGIIIAVVGLWYLHRYLKSDFINSIEHKPSHQQKPTTVQSSTKKTVAVKKTHSNTKDTVASKPAVKTDNFKRLDGIGPKTAKLLEDKGILSYQQFSEMDDKQLTDIFQKAGVRIRQTDPAYWTKQAKLAAEGKWDDIKKLQQKQKGKRNGKVAKAA